jgi:hypothetical protein
MNREKLLLAAGCAAFVGAVATAQPTASPPAFAAPPYTNLQIFPKDITRDQLLGNMKFFAQSLGVRCTHCHAGAEGKLEFASDAKPEKATARKMLAMVHRINSQDFGVTDFANVKVTCYTCHRGARKPDTKIPPVVPVQVPPPPPERG